MLDFDTKFDRRKRPISLEIYESIPNATRLIHCDYNLKNILVKRIGSDCKVVRILNWEFAAAGSPLMDIGNYLRFADELPRLNELTPTVSVPNRASCARRNRNAQRRSDATSHLVARDFGANRDWTRAV